MQTQAPLFHMGPAQSTYFNDPRDARQGGKLIGCSFAGCRGHQTQEGGLGDRERKKKKATAQRSLNSVSWVSLCEWTE